MLNDAIKDLNLANHSFTRMNEKIVNHFKGLRAALESCRLEFILINDGKDPMTVRFDYYNWHLILVAKIIDVNTARFSLFSEKMDLPDGAIVYQELAQINMNNQGILVGQVDDDNIGYSLIPAIRNYILGAKN